MIPDDRRRDPRCEAFALFRTGDGRLTGDAGISCGADRGREVDTCNSCRALASSVSDMTPCAEAEATCLLRLSVRSQRCSKQSEI